MLVRERKVLGMTLEEISDFGFPAHLVVIRLRFRITMELV